MTSQSVIGEIYPESNPGTMKAVAEGHSEPVLSVKGNGQMQSELKKSSVRYRST